MGKRLRVLVFVLVVCGVGILLGTSLSQERRDSPETETPDGVSRASGRVKVEVLNGGGIPGAAWEATRALRELGFDVVGFGNAGTYSNDSSVVMDRVGAFETARAVAFALGISQVRSEPDSTLFVDVTVRLGPDWTGPVAVVEEKEEASPWWDLRRFFQERKAPKTENPTGQ